MKSIARFFTSCFDSPWKKDLFFFLTLISCFFIYRYEYLIHFNPSGPHTWRQADSISLIDNYYSHGMRFFWPEIHYQISDDDTSGYTAGEFPGLYYLNALLWTLFGKHVEITRLASILITFLGLFSLYRTNLLWTKNYFWSVVGALFILSTPTIAEYGANFLTDVPAFAFALVGWYFFSRFYHEGKDRLLLWVAVFFMIAGLLKVSALIIFVIIVILWALEALGLRLADKPERLFERPAKQGAILSIAFIGILSWYAYASHFDYVHVGKYTFNHPWPIWELSQEQITKVATDFWSWTSVFTMPRLYWYLLPILLLGWIFLLHRLSVIVRIVCLFTLAGTLGYFSLWFQAIDQHDYYFANSFVLLAVLPLPYLTAGINLRPWVSNAIKACAVLLLIYGLIYTRQNIELRHYPEEKFAYPLMPKDAVGLMKWYNWERTSRVRGLRHINPLLDSLGVTEDKKVVIMPDPTINHTLYLIDRKGWTGFGPRSPREVIDDSVKKGAEFLIVLHPDLYLTPDMQSLKDFRIGKLENVEIIDLRKFQDAGSPR
ncbi:MAG: glycosyltransferase family 39 protein [Flavobacteriales bacterium]|nr:glycosyltransferase family 39 protein [Flavobacteriales bacterium]